MWYGKTPSGIAVEGFLTPKTTVYPLYNKLVLAAQQTGLTQAEFNDFVNSRPDYFRLENRSDNQSHHYEKPGNNDLREIIVAT